MKRLLLTFALIFAFVCAQAADITSISNAFKAGNASSLSGAMDKKESGFLVGKLPTSSGEYRVNITYRAEGNTAIIQSIRIE